MSESIKGMRFIQFARHDQSGSYGLLLVKSHPRREFPTHRHDFYEFEVLVRGSLCNTVNGKSEVVAPGDFWCLSPDEVHRVTPLSDDVLIYNISVQASAAAEPIRKAVARFSFPSAGRLSEEKLSALVAIYDVLFRDSRAGGEDEALRVGSLCHYVLLSLLGAVNRSLLPTVPKGAMQYVLRATAIVREEYQRDLRLGEVAERLGISSGYLSSIISECLGSTFKEYLTATRVRRAMALLAGTTDTVTEVAFASGFGSFSAFERMFSRLCGMTPKEYRRFATK